MEIYKKLLEARLSISAKKVKKDGTNTFSNYDYFTPVLVAALTSDVCKEFNLLSLFSLKKDEHGYYGELIIVNIDAPKEQIVTQMRTEKPSITATNNAQQMGGCETYTKRYMLMSAFGIADNSLDFDGHDNTKSQPIEKQKFKKEVSEWLSEEGFKDAMCMSNVEELRGFLKEWITAPKGMKKEYKDKITEHGKMLAL